MKEWWNRDGIYKELKEDAQKEALFFSDLVNVIEKHTEFCISATIVLRVRTMVVQVQAGI